MTSPALTLAAAPRRPRRPAAPRAFTLVELLIVIGIVAVLMGLLVPVLASVIRQRNRTAVSMTLAAIGSALDAYRQDFGDIPRLGVNPVTPTVNNPTDPLNVAPDRGARLLARALVGPAPIDDGLAPAATSPDPRFRFEDGHGEPANPAGFKERRQTVQRGNETAVVFPGPVKGPYLDLNRVNLRKTTDAGLLSDGYVYGPDTVVLDPMNDQPILYYPALARPGDLADDDDGPGFTTVGGNYISVPSPTQATRSLFSASDNPGSDDTGTPPLQPGLTFRDPANGSPALPKRYFLANLLGDANQNGLVDAGESPVTSVPYLLIAGGDEGFQYEADAASPRYRTWSSAKPITNFPFAELK